MNNKNALKSFVVWFCMAIFYFYCFIARSSFITVLAKDFMKFYAIDAIGLSALTSCYYWIYTGMQIPVGIICDKFSLRKTATLMCLITAIGVFTIVATHSFYIAALGEMIIGFGSAFAFILCLKVITAWFPENKIAIMSAYTMSLGGFGPVVGGPTVSFITQKFMWRDVIMVFAGIGVLLAIAIYTIVRDHKAKAEVNEEHAPIMESLKMILKSKQAWILSLFTMALYSPLSALGDLWGVSFVETVFKADRGTATIASNMIYIGMVLGGPLMATLAVKLNSYKKVMLLGIISEAVCLGISISIPETSIYIAFALLFATGICSGAMLSYPLALTLFPKRISATVSGFVNMMSMVSGIILMPAFGFVLNMFWDGTIENGIKIYSAGDFKCGVIAVILFICVGVVITMFTKDRSPRAGEYS